MVKRSKTDAVVLHVAACGLALATMRAIYVEGTGHNDAFVAWVPWMFIFLFLVAAFFASQYWVGPTHLLRDPVTESVVLSVVFLGWFVIGCLELAYGKLQMGAFLVASAISLAAGSFMAFRAWRLANHGREAGARAGD
jgi:hypothetical protein